MNRNAENLHYSVLLNESMDLLKPTGGGTFIDATLGAGGHSEAILEANSENRLIAFDQDEDAIEIATKRLDRFSNRLLVAHRNFEDLKSFCDSEEISGVDGIIADLGVSSMQLDTGERGFSFRIDAPLDMRMDPESGAPSAAEFLAEGSQEEIANVIYEFGEERFSRRIARRIINARSDGNPVETTKQLAEIVLKSVPKKKNEKIHPATKTFQALRVHVNRELEVLESFIKSAISILAPEGRLVIISFHSLEDRIVKRSFQKFAGKCFCPRGFPKCVCGASKSIQILTKKPVTPEPQELNANPRSRSARLRAALRLT